MHHAIAAYPSEKHVQFLYAIAVYNMYRGISGLLSTHTIDILTETGNNITIMLNIGGNIKETLIFEYSACSFFVSFQFHHGRMLKNKVHQKRVVNMYTITKIQEAQHFQLQSL